MIHIFIQCRLRSKRLPNKSLIKFFNETIIERLIRIAKKTKFKKKIFLLSGSKQNNLKLIKFAKKFKIKIFFGNESNVLERYYNAIKHFKIDNKDFIMRLTADNYLIQPNILNKLSEYRKNYEYISFDPLSHYSGELFSVESFTKKIMKKSLSRFAKQHVTWDFRRQKNIKRKKLSSSLLGINHLHKITLDTQKDYKYLKKIEKNHNFKKLDCLKELREITNRK